MELLTHSCHAVMSFFWPEDGAGSSYLEHSAARSAPAAGRPPRHPPSPSPLHAEQLQGLPGRQALELVPHDLGLRGERR